MGRPKLYKDDAEKQAAYRLRMSGPPLAKARKTAAALESNLRKQFLELRKEITRKRKEAGDIRKSRNWNPEAIIKLEQSDLLNFIETELDKIGNNVT